MHCLLLHDPWLVFISERWSINLRNGLLYNNGTRLWAKHPDSNPSESNILSISTQTSSSLYLPHNTQSVTWYTHIIIGLTCDSRQLGQICDKVSGRRSAQPNSLLSRQKCRLGSAKTRVFSTLPIWLYFVHKLNFIFKSAVTYSQVAD